MNHYQKLGFNLLAKMTKTTDYQLILYKKLDLQTIKLEI